ncbi:MAG: hypothetical protein U0Z53_20845 [Blastocatellia bacterium]
MAEAFFKGDVSYANSKEDNNEEGRDQDCQQVHCDQEGSGQSKDGSKEDYFKKEIASISIIRERRGWATIPFFIAFHTQPA